MPTQKRQRRPNTREVLTHLTEAVERAGEYTVERDIGEVVEVGDGIARVSGLLHVRSSESVRFSNGAEGVVLNLEPGQVGVMLLSTPASVCVGERVKASGELLSIPVGTACFGRVLDPLGRPLDDLPPPTNTIPYRLERPAPGIMEREPVTIPLQTGIKIIDALIPIGRGQRELIIGDRQTGKTTIAIDTILQQRDQGVRCIYVAIGQKASTVAQTVETLRQHGALAYTSVIAANASDPASLQYLAPFAGCALGEWVMDQGEDALVVYDDLSKHAWAYRELSLLLRRPPGREAYPGDIFYLHSRLLERAARRSPSAGGGSLTALPIIETQAGDISAYIPTNVISITDGQIFLEKDLFYRGIRPAVNVGLSVSRVGGAAQIKAMKTVAGPLRLTLAQYRELEGFAQFSSDLDEQTRQQIDYGKRLTEILKQAPHDPCPVPHQVALLYAMAKPETKTLSPAEIIAWQTRFLTHLERRDAAWSADLLTARALTPELERRLAAVLRSLP